jgi:hypothetical protein
MADTYERVQAIRIEAGERIRAVVQGRTAGERDDVQPAGQCASTVLARIRSGRSEGPVPVLGHTYRVHWLEEQRLRSAMSEALEAHDAWPWLGSVRGMGATLGAKLLSRLDIHQAPTPSSFWAYCGLATVAAGNGLRSAQPRTRRGEKPAYDRYARRVCYQVGCALLRSGGAYACFYRRERIRLDGGRPDWNRAHCHMAALRKTEKLLLAHLWVTWAERAGVPQCRPYACAGREQRTGYIEPYAMIERSE